MKLLKYILQKIVNLHMKESLLFILYLLLVSAFIIICAFIIVFLISGIYQKETVSFDNQELRINLTTIILYRGKEIYKNKVNDIIPKDFEAVKTHEKLIAKEVRKQFKMYKNAYKR